MLLSVSLLNSKDRLSDVKKLNKLENEYFHIDVMDGNFVLQKAYTIEEIKTISTVSKKKLDIHLMVDNPIEYIEKIRKLPNINNITIHLEIKKDIKDLLLKIKDYNIKCGLSIKPNTDINLLKPYLNILDLILIMTVEPGLGGQKFLEESVERIYRIKSLIEDKNILLEVDGGINDQTIKKVNDLDIAVVGSYITTSNNMEEAIKKLKV